MANLVIAYPELEKADYDWIQNVRRDHDKRNFSVVRPHISLVFGTDKLDIPALADHPRNCLRDTKRFNVAFSSTKIVEDHSNTFFHLFLIPSEGYDEIDQIHSLLYGGALQSELRVDIPFIPHLSIGNGSEAEMVALKQEIDRSGLNIQGMVHELSIVQDEGQHVTDYLKVELI